jgi:hypothetical protein
VWVIESFRDGAASLLGRPPLVRVHDGRIDKLADNSIANLGKMRHINIGVSMTVE